MHDLRLAFRSLRATPVVTLVAILSLALGIGANTAMFSLVDSLILRALPVKHPQQLALVTDDLRGVTYWTNPIWEAMRGHRQLVDGMFAWSDQRFNLASGGETQFVDGVWTSGGMFDTLGVPAMLGRTLTEADDRRGGGPDGAVAVISYGFWQRRFGGAADAIGRTLTIERVPFTIVGVTPPDFFGPSVGRAFDVAIPIGCEPLVRGKESFLDRRSTWWLTVMVRLRPSQTIDAGTTAMRGAQAQVREATMPPDWPAKELATYLKDPLTLVPAATGLSTLRQRYERPLVTIMIVVSLVLLIACANIANLLMARAAARRHEWSVRLALGASRWRLVRLLLTESLVLSAAGAVFGAILAQWGSRLLVQQLSTQTNTVFLDLSIDWRVLAFTTAVTVVTALLFGTAPAFRAANAVPMEAIKENTRGATGDARVSVASGLVVAQVALSVVLVVAAGLFVRTFSSLANLHLGFDSERVLIANVNVLRTQIAPENRLAVYERIRQAVAAVPGVASVGVSDITPVAGMTWNGRITVSGGVELPERLRQANLNAITSGWLTTFGTPLLAGRDFTERDTAASPRIALVNEAFARKFLSGASPIGHTVQPNGFAPAPPREIVGLVADAVYRNLREPVPATMYVPLSQFDTQPGMPARPQTSVSVRAAAGSPALLTRSVAAAILGVNPDVALTFRTLSDQVNASLTQERIVAMLSGFFGALALLLAGLGLYGITSYAVTRRRTEIGIRMALGAAPGGVVRLVLTRVTLLVALGVAIGAGLSAWAAQFVSTLLYGLQPRDPITLAAAAITLAIVGALAGWLPAYRASRIDPAQVLRDS
jgi:putative ABC transport system permease protein